LIISTKDQSAERGEAGRVANPVTIVDYDPRWPMMYVDEKAEILKAVGSIIVAIEHIGSTAVTGLAARSITDMMFAVRNLEDAESCIQPLQTIGYELEGEMPERRFFRRGQRGAGTHHLHMVEIGSDFWERHLLFRDYLLVHPEAAQQYSQLKKELAPKFCSDRDAYTDAKTNFIESVVAAQIG
jgi:GrpB-like predicted nucleotidyltransferase (UPF0157 family)